MSAHPTTGFEEVCKIDHVFLPTADVGGVSTQPICTPSPKLDWVQISKNESPKLKTPEESDPLKAIPLDVPSLSHALSTLTLTSEPGCISLVQSASDYGLDEGNPATVKSAQSHHHLIPPLVIAPDLFDPDPTDLFPTVPPYHSARKKNKKGKRKKKAPSLPTNMTHQIKLWVTHAHLLWIFFQNIFEMLPPHPSLNPGVNQGATNDDEGENKTEANELDWIKLAQPSIRDEITGAMLIEDILAHLTHHGCEDVTDKLEIESSSSYPVTNGGFGDVYRVSLHDGRQLAFKCVRLRVGADLDGQKYLQFRGQLAMVSPWVENGDLKRFIGCYPKVDRCALCVQVADGVTYLHGRGIANILVSQDRIVKITDFGNAALAEYSLYFTSNAGGCSVSPRWTAPEILEEKTKTTVVGDIFALGMTILEVITGASPYDEVKDVVVSTKILNRVRSARPEAHMPTGSKHADRLWSLLTRCWEYDGQDRPTALQVRDEMIRITPKGLKSVPRAFRR
ncbi:kinase-like domain-containing protein [Rhizoctonia solani]|nr:kinase-like domain-containing protein [Rhizoctonia solani]